MMCMIWAWRCKQEVYTQTHPFTALCPGLPGWAGTRKVKPKWILLKQDCKRQWVAVLWCCWLGNRKGSWPVRNSAVGCCHSYLSGARCKLQTCIWPRWCHCHSLSLVSVKSRLVFAFLVPAHPGSLGQRPLNGCVCAETAVNRSAGDASVFQHDSTPACS